MSGDYFIRRAKEDDAEAVARLAGELGYAVDAARMRKRIRAILETATDLLIVARDSSAGLVGWLQAQSGCTVESGFRVEITGLIVSATYRRRHVGRALVREAERWAEAKSAESVVVRSNVRRVESHFFYPVMGYSIAKTQTVFRKQLPEAGREGARGNSAGGARKAGPGPSPAKRGKPLKRFDSKREGGAHR